MPRNRDLSIFLPAAMALAAGIAYGQATTLYADAFDFGASAAYAHPTANTVFDGAGNRYGFVAGGGANAVGSLWEVTKSGTLIDLHDFGSTSTDGKTPSGSLVIDKSGNLYGVTVAGGAHGGGMLWEYTSEGAFEDLHDFGAGVDGTSPQGGVSFSAGNMYGTTLNGGVYGHGMVWELTPAGVYTDLTNITGGKGGNGAIGPLAFDSLGNIYGCCYSGGVHGWGFVWKLNMQGSYFNIHDFGGTTTNASGSSGPDGASPVGGVLVDSAGNLYGVTEGGGAGGANVLGYGMVWEISAAGNYLDLHDFGLPVTLNNGSTGLDGTVPLAGLCLDALGNVYGTTSSGAGSHNGGNVWEVTTAHKYFDLHDFGGTVINAGGTSGPDGMNPQSALGLDSSGNIYGTTEYGGPNQQSTSNGSGIMFCIPSWVSSVTLAPASLTEGNTTQGTVTLQGPAPATGIVLSLTSSSSLVTAPSTVTVAAGMTTATFKAATKLAAGSYASVIGAHYGAGFAAENLTVLVPAVSTLTLSPSSVPGGTASTGTVTLTCPAQPGGISVALLANTDWVSIPASVVVAAGQSTASFTINTIVPYGTGLTNIEASYGSSSSVATLTVVAPVLTSLTLNPSVVAGGLASTATVTISSIAPPTGATISIASNTSMVTVPSSVVVPAGQTTVSFTVNTSPVFNYDNANVQATWKGVSMVTRIYFSGTALSSITVNPTSVVGGSPTTGTVTLAGEAPAVGFPVSLATNYKQVTVPASVTVPAGQTSVTFPITTSPVAGNLSVVVKASLGSQFVETNLTLTPPVLTSISLNPSSVVGGTPSTATVTLGSAAPPSGMVVSLQSNSGFATVPSTVTIPSGQSSASFTVATTSPISIATATISASLGTKTVQAMLTIQTPTLVSLNLNPTTVAGGTTSTGTVTVGVPAPSGGLTITLASSNTTVKAPPTVTVGAGQTSASFTVTTVPATGTVTSTISATYGAQTLQATLTVVVPVLVSVTVNPATVPAGTNSTGTVTLDGPAPAGGVLIMLSCSTPLASVQPSVVVPAGQTSASFTIPTNTRKLAGLTTITASYGTAQVKTAVLDIT